MADIKKGTERSRLVIMTLLVAIQEIRPIEVIHNNQETELMRL